MLGKQAWGIWNMPSSLIARCLQAKYFAHNDFLSATLGTRPSYLWRSILSGRDVLQSGLRYRVGNGESIQVYKDKWISRPHGFKLFSARPSSFREELRVCDLIDWNNLQWRMDLLMQHFLPIDVAEIIKIPLSLERPSDCLVWHFTKKGDYTVKSANRMLQAQHESQVDLASTSTHATSVGFWKQLWKLPCLPKVKIFLWKAVTNILPTSLNLNRKTHVIPPYCSLCKENEESDCHILFECPWAGEVWTDVNFGQRWQRQMATSFKDMLQSVFMWQEPCEVSRFVHLFWLIWKNRCAKTFGGEVKSKQALILEAENLTTNLLPTTRFDTPPTSPYLSTWTPPSPDQVTINGDVAFTSNGESSSGILIRNYLGQTLSAVTIRLPCNLDVEHGELLTIYHGLVLAQSHDLDSVNVWSDSLTCVNMLRETDITHHYLGSLLMECHRLAKMFKHCSFNFVKREGNMPAHLLASYDLNYE